MSYHLDPIRLSSGGLTAIRGHIDRAAQPVRAKNDHQPCVFQDVAFAASRRSVRAPCRGAGGVRPRADAGRERRRLPRRSQHSRGRLPPDQHERAAGRALPCTDAGQGQPGRGAAQSSSGDELFVGGQARRVRARRGAKAGDAGSRPLRRPHRPSRRLFVPGQYQPARPAQRARLRPSYRYFRVSSVRRDERQRRTRLGAAGAAKRVPASSGARSLRLFLGGADAQQQRRPFQPFPPRPRPQSAVFGIVGFSTDDLSLRLI